MSEKDKEELKEYADGWMTERKGTDVPMFLKIATPVVGLGAVGYIIVQMSGDLGHATRGPLVAQFIKVSQTSPGLQYFVALLALIFVIIAAVFGFRAFKED
jgi:preprotein translocase subunit SecG